MSSLVQPRLVNGPTGDSTLFLDFAFGRRAFLFDCGDLSPLSAREIGRVSHVFVSHLHMDHFAGFDRLLRLRLNQPGMLRLFGPPGLADGVAAKLAAYRWNLLDENSADFVIEAQDWTEQGFAGAWRFRARGAFARRPIDLPDCPPGLVLSEPELMVEAVQLDHGIPSLAFALQERLRVNVHKAKLDAMELPVGPWLSAAKAQLRAGAGEGAVVEGPNGEALSLGTLLRAGAFHRAPGQRVAYITDAGWSEGNRERILRIAAGANTLFIEAGFLHADHAIANGRHHLTAAQAGALAREAGARRAVPHHFSPRYEGGEDALTAEFGAAYRRSGEA
ncbi:ribonuclease Z [Aureimonas sp. AU40]|uniref:ribonuclease Z n=1 Tax=Aureimonas sp. AU40 TaxID=1637747 RepID=UPI000785C14A|nr:MBL fold metallo-hydrolase [Aureimonas sp. AU40]